MSLRLFEGREGLAVVETEGPADQRRLRRGDSLSDDSTVRSGRGREAPEGRIPGGGRGSDCDVADRETAQPFSVWAHSGVDRAQIVGRSEYSRLTVPRPAPSPRSQPGRHRAGGVRQRLARPAPWRGWGPSVALLGPNRLVHVTVGLGHDSKSGKQSGADRRFRFDPAGGTFCLAFFGE